MIIIPSKSIINRPKLNIANDNIYENISYTKQNRTYDKYIQLWQRDLYLLDLSKLVTNGTAGIRWSPPFTQEYETSTLNSNNGGDDLKNYRYLYGQELNDNLRIYIPNNANNYHYFLVKITIPKPDKNIDYSKLSFRYSDDVTYNRPYAMNGTIQIESARLYDFIEGDFTRPIEKNNIFDENTTEQQMLSHFVNSDFSQIITYNTMDMFVQLRITEDNLEFYCNGLVLIGTPATQNIGGSISAIYTRTISFYYVEMQSKSENLNIEHSKYSLPDNELLAEQTTYEDNSIYEQIESSIVSEYEYGKHSVDLTCLYMEYKDELGLTVYNGKDGNLISVGDIICPYYYNNEMNEVPIATYEDGTPMQFIVYKSNLLIDDNNFIKNEISAIELKQEEFNPALNYTGLDANGNMEGQLAFDGTIVAYAIGKPDIVITSSTDPETGEVTSTEDIYWDNSNGLNSEYLGVDVTQASNTPYSNLGIDNVVIPNSYNGKPITKILNQAFYSRYSNESSVSYYGASAIKTLTLGENILELNEVSCYWFDGELIFNSKIQTLKDSSLYSVFLGVFDLPMSIKFLGNGVFGSNMDKLNVYGNVTNLPEKTGIYDSILVVEFKTSVTEVVGSICNVAPCDMVFRHTNSNQLTLNIEAMKSAYETTIYTDNDYVKSYDWASKNYTVTFKSLSEYTGS